ncbi:MAG: hypothetical protein IH609_06925 [Dehalococcoidia bacterium]|nr:hypothetical protein [Dehalococcoidia bacterium]
MNISHRRPGSTRGLLLLALAVAILAAGCSPRDAEGERRVVDAPIEAIDILVRESFPPGYTAKITSGLPSGCARFHEAKISGRSGTTIAISVTNTMPSDPETICTDIYGYHETNLDLGQDFVSGQTYSVSVNDKTTTFRAQ